MNSRLACAVSGVVMADGVDGGVVDYRDWKHVSAVYYDDGHPSEEGKEDSRAVSYWISLKNGGLVGCESEYRDFVRRLGLKPDITGGVRDIAPVLKVKGKPFLPSGVAC